MYASFVNSAINIFDTSAPFYERIDMSSSTSSRESSTSPASPKMATDSGYVSENNERPDASMSSAFRVEHAAPANNYLTENHTAQNRIARESINDQCIPVTGFQLSVFFNVALFIYILDMKLPLILLAVLIAALAVFRVFSGAPFDFAGFRFVSTAYSAIVYKEEVNYVPLEKHVTHYMVKEKHVTHYIFKEKPITHYIVKEATTKAIKSKMGSAVLIIASKFNQQVRSQAEIEQWYIDTIPLSPYEDVEPSKRATLFQWLDEFSTLDPIHDLLTSKSRTAPKQLGDTSAHKIDRPFDFPTVFETHLEEVTSYNETAESFGESFDFPTPHPDAPAGSEAYINDKALDNHYAPQFIIDNHNYDA
jgi:hypothetical protein